MSMPKGKSAKQLTADMARLSARRTKQKEDLDQTTAALKESKEQLKAAASAR